MTRCVETGAPWCGPVRARLTCAVLTGPCGLRGTQQRESPDKEPPLCPQDRPPPSGEWEPQGLALTYSRPGSHQALWQLFRAGAWLGPACTVNNLRAALLLWAVAASTGTDMPLAQDTGFQKCKDALKLPVLEVLPGGGWDNLRNLDMARVLDLTYTDCKTTEDGQYIIPSDVFTIPRKQTNLEMNSEVLESWKNYKSSTSFSINADISVYSTVSGKFSAEFERIKTLQVKDQAITTRAQVRNLVYTVKINPTSELSREFKKHLLDIADRLENNQLSMATYLAELLVLQYGTHAITSVEAGAALMQEDHVRASFLQDSQVNKKSLSASAGATFSKIVNVKLEAGYASQDSFTKDYLANRTDSRVQSIGGVPFYPGITLQVWQEGMNNHLVALDRAGLPLHFFIKPDTLPELPGPLVKSVSNTVEAAVRRYYTFNTYPGCTDSTSPNFDFQANTDDGSCTGKMNNFSFGGVYQECTQVSGGPKVNLCQSLEQKNPLTGKFSCPSGYSPIQLLSQAYEKGYNNVECKKSCTLRVFCKTKCEDVFRVAKAEFRTFWCAARGKVPDNSGLLFGGLFSSDSTNPVTGAQSCPESFLSLRLFRTLTVCVSQDAELGSAFSVPFGGFFSCTVGNPLVNSSASSYSSEKTSQKKCPRGFSQHVALISDGCQVSYCVKAGAFTIGSLPPVRLPPFTHPSLMSEALGNGVVVTKNENTMTWNESAQGLQWRLEEPLELRSTRTGIREDSTGMSGGTAAGVTAGVTIVLAAAIAGVVYGMQRYKKKSHQDIKERERGKLATSFVACMRTSREQQHSPA
ncbi:macrophage-expressed gene 1 protein-like [Ctenodactylus gundi]